MFCSLIFVLFVFCGNIELNHSADKLEFWTGYPAPARRAQANHKKANQSINKSANDITDFRFKKAKASNGEKKNKTTARVENEGKLRSIPQSRYRVQDRNLDGDTDADQQDSWPKVQHRAKHKDAVRSTRLTPAYLMQQDEETTVKEDPDFDIDLSPYSIKKEMSKLAKKFPDANITIEVIGRTAEYNDIVMLKVAETDSDTGKYFRADETKYIDEVPEKKIVVIVHGLSVMGLGLLPCLVQLTKFRELISYYFAHLDKFDIFLIPMANPDGFTQREELWNKNMSPQGACSGVALDRNFDVAWNSSSSFSSCSQHYPGPAPFSEPETRAIREVLHQYSHKITAYFHVHSGSYTYSNFKGDAVLYPKGYTDVQTDDDKYIDLRAEIDETMKNASFQVLSVAVDTLHSWYGKISGSSVDYASSVYGIPYALELVMQPYEDNDNANVTEEYSSSALREIWKRIIDVIFNTIWRNTKNNEV